MLRKYLARLLAFALVLNLVLCAPLSVGAEEVKFEAAQNNVQKVDIVPNDTTFDADPITVGTREGDIAVTETVPEHTVSGDANSTESLVTVGEQTVSVEGPLDPLLQPEPNEGSAVTVGDDKITYDSTIGSVDTPAEVVVEQSLDLKAEVTGAASDGSQSGDNLTDIEYQISLDEKVTTTPNEGSAESSSYTLSDIDQAWAAVPDAPAENRFKVNMSINGMNDQEVTRVEHKYKETEDGDVKVEYYYNPNTKTNTDADNGKKFFTVVKETVKNVQSSFVSLVTNFLGKFHITTDAFEGAADDKGEKATYSDLASAVNNAETGSTVEMLRDYEASGSATITNSSNVTVDLNGKTYTSGITSGNAVTVTGSNQTLTIQNGTINSGNRGVLVKGDNNKLTVDNIDLTAEGDVGIFDSGNKNTTTIKNSEIRAKSNAPYTIYHNGSYGGANIEIIGSYVSATSKNGWAIYISGSKYTTDQVGLNNLTLTDSTIEGSETGVEVKYTNVTINNSKLVDFGVPPEYVGNNNGTTTSGVALAVTDNRTFNDDGTVKSKDNTAGTIIINSGYFYGHKDIDNIYVAAKLESGDSQATIQLNGGRFVNVKGLYNLTGSTHAVISHNDGSEYPYEVVAAGTTPTRAGYKFLGYKDDKGNAITLEQAIAKKAIAYAQWELIPAEADETPVKPATAPAEKPVIIVEPDSKGNNVDVTIKGGTAEVTVSTPAGEAAAVSEVTIPSVAALQERGVKTVNVQVEENVTLELGVAKDDDTVADTIKITREDDILVITSGEQSEIAIHMTALKAAAAKPVSIKLDNGVLTIDLGNGAYKLNVGDALAASKILSVKLENGVLKLYDKDGNLIQEIKI